MMNGDVRLEADDSGAGLPAPAPTGTAEPSVGPRPTLLGSAKRAISVGRLWYYSTQAYKAKLFPLAWFIKALIFVLYKSVLCVQCEIEDDVVLVHMGLGCVIHPNVTIGRRVRIFHHVSMAAEATPGSPSRIIVEDDVIIGLNAILIGNPETGLRIGKGAVIGAGAIVNRDVPPGAVVLPMPSRPVKMVKQWDT